MSYHHQLDSCGPKIEGCLEFLPYMLREKELERCIQHREQQQENFKQHQNSIDDEGNPTQGAKLYDSHSYALSIFKNHKERSREAREIFYNRLMNNTTVNLRCNNLKEYYLKIKKLHYLIKKEDIKFDINVNIDNKLNYVTNITDIEKERKYKLDEINKYVKETKDKILKQEDYIKISKLKGNYLTEHNNKLTNLNNSLKRYEKTHSLHQKRLEIINNLIAIIKKFEIYMNEFNELINNFKNDGNPGDTGYNEVIDKLNLVEGLKNKEYQLTILEPTLTELEKYDFQESKPVFTKTKTKTIEEIFTENLNKEDKEKLIKQKEQDILIPKTSEPSESLKRSTPTGNRISFANYRKRKLENMTEPNSMPMTEPNSMPMTPGRMTQFKLSRDMKRPKMVSQESEPIPSKSRLGRMSQYEKSQLQYGGSVYDAPSQDYFLRN